MSATDVNELAQLALTLCPSILVDLPSMTEAELRGVLVWLRRKFKESTP